MAGILTKLNDVLKGYNLEDVKQFCMNNVRTALVFGVSVTACWLMFKKPRGIPPGPSFTLPIVGDLLRIGNIPDGDIRPTARKFRKKYGDIFSIYLGPKLFIVINGYDAIKEALVKNGDIFSERPPLFYHHLIAQHKGIIFSSGQVWKDQRKFAVETLQEFGLREATLEDKIHEELKVLLDIVSKRCGKPFDMRRLTQTSVCNIIASLVHGQRFDHNDPLFRQFLDRTEMDMEVAGSTAILNFFPFLRYLPGDVFKWKRTMKHLRDLEESIIAPSIQQHKENYDKCDRNDYISSYLKEMKIREALGKTSDFNERHLIKSIADLFVAGTETTSTTILWTILYFLHHPNVEAKCYKEIHDVVGFDRLPILKDMDNMQYTQAVILEVLRITNIVILGAPHSVPKDVVFRRYTIPKDTLIIPNLDSVLADEGVWGDPDVFRPERFLDENGQLTKREEMIPFSIGKRMCPWESFTKMELFLFLTSLIQRFEFRAVDLRNPPPLKGNIGVTHTPGRFRVSAIQRI